MSINVEDCTNNVKGSIRYEGYLEFLNVLELKNKSNNLHSGHNLANRFIVSSNIYYKYIHMHLYANLQRRGKIDTQGKMIQSRIDYATLFFSETNQLVK